MPVRVSSTDVIAFRLGAHDLMERLDATGLLDAAGRCGVQDSPPGSAATTLHHGSVSPGWIPIHAAKSPRVQVVFGTR